MKKFLVPEKYLHLNLALILVSDVSKCKAFVREHFLFQFWQVRYHCHICLVLHMPVDKKLSIMARVDL